MAGLDELLDVREYPGEGYRPLVDFGSWRVAVLNYIEELRADNLRAMQRHDETDEVFVLLRGRCILFLGEGQDAVTAVHARNMEPFKIYTVKKAAWHTHTLTEDAMVLIVENRDTDVHNSPCCPLTGEQSRDIVRFTRGLWPETGWD
ncbi:MAG TPA: hypothetical protein PLT76_03210 [Candidatus Omnitrophota bacterium]|nr:hypothetical protein [Candidatus Omnitrophota bacterium]HPB68259.1 hypothetical protein [Candidatus Omnitrophota bacterium]HQO57713.1 hypothetical protein [Candidatus Omnitrophota bacterium]HQP12647.1 hypothetical protein [Candidatus Omnitrophota bacterium]